MQPKKTQEDKLKAQPGCMNCFVNCAHWRGSTLAIYKTVQIIFPLNLQIITLGWKASKQWRNSQLPRNDCLSEHRIPALMYSSFGTSGNESTFRHSSIACSRIGLLCRRSARAFSDWALPNWARGLTGKRPRMPSNLLMAPLMSPCQHQQNLRTVADSIGGEGGEGLFWRPPNGLRISFQKAVCSSLRTFAINDVGLIHRLPPPPVWKFLDPTLSENNGHFMCGLHTVGEWKYSLAMHHLTQFKSFRRQSWQPITRLIPTKLNNNTEKYR